MTGKCKLAVVGRSEPGKPDSESVCGEVVDEHEHSYTWETATCTACWTVRAQYFELTLRGEVETETGALLHIPRPIPHPLAMRRR